MGHIWELGYFGDIPVTLRQQQLFIISMGLFFYLHGRMYNNLARETEQAQGL